MTPFSRGRRFAVAAVALFVAAGLLHTQIAEALTVRGDEYLYRARPADALERYKRALALAPDLESAADRFVFVSMEQHSDAALRSGISVANRYLARHPEDALLLSDRGLCSLIGKRFGAAQRDFEKAARITGNPQTFLFAGWAAWHGGRAADARALWRSALKIDPHNAAALKALSRIANA